MKGKEKEEFQLKYPHRKIIEIALKTEDGAKEITALVLVPNAKESLDYMTYADKDMHRASRTLLAKCLLTYKEEITADDELFLAAATGVMSLVKVGTFEIKNV